MSKEIIDLRSRPAFLHDFYGATPGTDAYETAKWLNRRLGSHHEEHFARSLTLTGYLEEIEQAGITQAVVVGRLTPSISIPNERIRDLVAPHPNLIGIGSVDPQSGGLTDQLDLIERAIHQYGLRGINIEPGFGAPPLRFDDPALSPLYDACRQLGCPVFLMTGPTTPDPAFAAPAPLAKVAADFPDLPIVLYHGCYPHVNEAIGLAFRHPNIHLVPDMYTFMPGSRPYIEAANGFLRDQLLFATSYPFRAMRQSVEEFVSLGFREEVLDGLLSGNARRLLGLTG